MYVVECLISKWIANSQIEKLNVLMLGFCHFFPCAFVIMHIAFNLAG